MLEVIARIPQEKVQIGCRVGFGEPFPLWTLIDRYVGYSEDLVGQILARL